MKVIYRYRTDSPCNRETIIQKLQKQERDNRAFDWQPAEIKRILSKREDNDRIEFVDSRHGILSFTAWKHYGVILDTGEMFADLGTQGANAVEERQRLKDYIESNGTDDYIELDDIIL